MCVVALPRVYSTHGTTHGRLKELLTGLEEEMADADDALSEKTDDLRSQEQVPTTEYMSPIPFDIQCVIFAVWAMTARYTQTYFSQIDLSSSSVKPSGLDLKVSQSTHEII